MDSSPKTQHENYDTLLIEGDSRFNDFFGHLPDTIRTVLTLCKSLGRTVTKDNLHVEEQHAASVFRDRLLSRANEEGMLDVLLTFMNESTSSEEEQFTESEEHDDDETENLSFEFKQNNAKGDSESGHRDEVKFSSMKKINLISSSGKNESTPEVIYERSPTETQAITVSACGHSDEDLLYKKQMNLSSSSGQSIATSEAVYERFSKEAQEQIEQMNEQLALHWLRVPLTAVQKNRIDIIKLCDKTGIGLEHFRHHKGYTLLHEVYCKEDVDLEMITFLLEKIDVNVVSDENGSVLNQCLLSKNIFPDEKLRRIEHLVAHGADATIRDNTMGSAIAAYLSTFLSVTHITAMDHWKTILDVLLQEGVNINQQDSLCQTALTSAICIVPPSGHEETLGDESIVNEQLEVRKQKLEIIKYLLSNKADPNLKDHSGCTALHIAIANQNLDVIPIIIEFGGDVNNVTNVGFSPVFTLTMEVTCLDEDEESSELEDVFIPIMQSLVKAGCDMNIKCIDRSTCLHFAAAERPAAMCELLVENGCDVNARDYLKRTPLHMAARNKDHRVAEILVKHGARTDLVDINNDTSLHHACLWENDAVVMVLINSGANVNAMGDLSIQPIHLAAENGKESMLQLLLTSGANIHARDSENATPLHYAAASDYDAKYVVNCLCNACLNIKEIMVVVVIEII